MRGAALLMRRFASPLCAASLMLSASGAFAQQAAPAAAAQSPVSEEELRAHVAYLASDELMGRAPGTAGETLALHYIAIALSRAGFVGGADDQGGWYQPVPLVELYPREGRMRLAATGNRAVPPLGQYRLRAPSGEARIADAPLVYVGHGVDDTGRVRADVRGKVALILAADRAGSNALALRQRRDAVLAAGAIGTIVIPAPQLPFAALDRRFSGGGPQLADWVSRGQVEGIVSADFADALLASGGTSAVDLRSAASAADYAGVDLPISLSADVRTIRRTYHSYNVIGRLPGRRPGSGAVLMTGHWDHLGLCQPERAADRICNGAADNASGIAVLLAAAQRLGAGPRPDRDIVVIGTTAEESGLLGAYHFAANPVVPLPSIAIALNVDTVAIAPRGAPVATIGRGIPAIDDAVRRTAGALGRAVDEDGEADAFVRRQDGWALQQAGIPSIMAGGSFSDMPRLQAFLGGAYHGPDDELTADTPLGGAADDADLHVALARHFASVTEHPLMREQ